MRRLLRWGVPLTAVLALAYMGISYFIASGVTSAERKEQEDHPASHGLDYRDVEFPSRGGDVRLSGWYMPGLDGVPAVVFVHGIGSTRSGDNAVDLAARLVDRGFAVLVFDLRGHGDSGGDRVTGGDDERRDVLGAIDYLVELGRGRSQIGVLGMSMGAGTSVLALVEEPAVQALVVDSSYAKLSDLIAHEIARKTVVPEWVAPVFVPGAKLLAGLVLGVDVGALVPERAVAELGYPVLIIHGDADTRVPVEHAVRLHLASHAGSDLWLADGVDHVDAFLRYPDEYVERVVSYFDARLRSQ